MAGFPAAGFRADMIASLRSLVLSIVQFLLKL
jgi:hypothetical protein